MNTHTHTYAYVCVFALQDDTKPISISWNAIWHTVSAASHFSQRTSTGNLSKAGAGAGAAAGGEMERGKINVYASVCDFCTHSLVGELSVIVKGVLAGGNVVTFCKPQAALTVRSCKCLKACVA